VARYAAFNPHASFHFVELDFAASDPAWKKWRTDQPPSAYWYRVADLRNLVAAYIAAEKDRLLRDFLTDFAGMSGTQVRQKVLSGAGITAGARLSELVVDNDIDLDKLDALLHAMQMYSKPIKPERLGVIGPDHLKKALTAVGAKNCKYARSSAFNEEGLPFVIEVASGVNRDEERSRRLHIGINWSPVFKIPSGIIQDTLNDARIQSYDPITLVIHLVQPRFNFSDHGKGALTE
jgi:hypothetical protein